MHMDHCGTKRRVDKAREHQGRALAVATSRVLALQDAKKITNAREHLAGRGMRSDEPLLAEQGLPHAAAPRGN